MPGAGFWSAPSGESWLAWTPQCLRKKESRLTVTLLALAEPWMLRDKAKTERYKLGYKMMKQKLTNSLEAPCHRRHSNGNVRLKCVFMAENMGKYI